MSEVELSKMLDHARREYARSVTPNDLALWGKADPRARSRVEGVN